MNFALGMSFVGRVSKKGALMYLIASLLVEIIHNPVPTHVGGLKCSIDYSLTYARF
jgi:hypothetical protein